MKLLSLSVALFAALCVSQFAIAQATHAQATQPKVKPAVPAAVTTLPTPPPADAIQTALPEHSELQKTKLENLQLKFTLLQQQQTQLQNEYQILVREIQAEHPGYTWNAQASRLVPVPKPSGAPKK